MTDETEPRAATVLRYGPQAIVLMQVDSDGWDCDIYQRAISWDSRLELGLRMARDERLIEEASIHGVVAFRLTEAGQEARAKIIRMEHLTP